MNKPYGKNVNTPWGKSDSKQVYIKGKVLFYGTAGHGGIFVEKKYAEDNLTIPALIAAIKWGKGYWYEEDCQYAIPMFELLEVRKMDKDLSEDDLLDSLSSYNKAYLKARGIPIKQEVK